MRYWNDTADKDAENQTPAEIEVEKTMKDKKVREKSHSALEFMRPKGPRYTFSACINSQQRRLLVELEVPKVCVETGERSCSG